MTMTAPRPSRSPLARAARATRLALAFLTIVPLAPRAGAGGGDQAENDRELEADLAASRFAYPLVGLLLGLVLAALSAGLDRLGTGPGIAAFALVAAGVALTGGLHLDGLADSFDGLFLWGGPDRRLAVMRDPHVGSFGVAALVLVLLGKYVALESLAGWERTLAILAAVATSRALLLVSSGLANYARPEGTGGILIRATTRRDALLGALTALALALAAGPAGLGAGIAALALAVGWTRLATGRLGGITGDTLGALVELSELLVLMGLS
jgi:adenosylcobinamide-GDP ribazoletransferase